MLLKSFKSIILLSLFIFTTSSFALDYAKLPEIVKTNITKQYKGKKIKVISVKSMGSKFRIIIKTQSGKDKVVVTKKGKILSISDYLKGMEASGGC